MNLKESLKQTAIQNGKTLAQCLYAAQETINRLEERSKAAENRAEPAKSFEKSEANEVLDAWFEHLESLDNLLPSGGGFDNGVNLIVYDFKPNRLVFQADFHHMNQDGFYTGWTEHKVIVTPAFNGIEIRVTGRNKNEIKEYIAETIGQALETPVSELFPS